MATQNATLLNRNTLAARIKTLNIELDDEDSDEKMGPLSDRKITLQEKLNELNENLSVIDQKIKILNADSDTENKEKRPKSNSLVHHAALSNLTKSSVLSFGNEMGCVLKASTLKNKKDKEMREAICKSINKTPLFINNNNKKDETVTTNLEQIVHFIEYTLPLLLISIDESSKQKAAGIIYRAIRDVSIISGDRDFEWVKQCIRNAANNDIDKMKSITGTLLYTNSIKVDSFLVNVFTKIFGKKTDDVKIHFLATMTLFWNDISDLTD
jgi:hypothetical protein